MSCSGADESSLGDNERKSLWKGSACGPPHWRRAVAMASAAATTAMSAADEEALIRKRLLTQTTTARPGADPPVKKLVKRYLAACQAARDGAGAEEAEKHGEAFLKELALYEFQLGRVAAVRSANAREMESYADARADVDDEVARARGDTRELRAHLDSARLDRQHKEEYEALRRLCARLPARATTEAACARLEEEIAALEAESDATAAKLHLRKKQFALLLHVVNELQEELEEDEAEEGEAEEGAVPMDAE